LIWALEDSPALPATARAEVTNAANEVFVSAASVWEIEIKRALGRLKAPQDVPGGCDAAGFVRLSISFDHGIGAGRLPLHHGDPFDRMLIAQARAEALTFATADHELARYDVPILDVSGG